VARPREYDEATRRALIDAASRRLAAGGPSAITLRSVAGDVGATTSAIYALFGSKTELLRAVYRAGFDGLARELDRVTPSGLPLRDLYELGLAYRRSALARPSLYLVMFATDVGDAAAPLARDVEVASGTLDRLRATVARCQAAGALDGDDPQPITLQLWALVHGLAMLELRGVLGDEATARAHWDAALFAAARGYAPGGDG
jgi:AcrR family transcriptional regulator